MIRKMRLFLGFTIALHFASAGATDAPLNVKVGLYPMGSFEITTPRIDGKGTKAGQNYSAKEIKVAVDSLTTGMSLRDKHLHEKLESDKYKNIIVSNVKATGGSGTADINIHNITKKNIAFTYKDAGPGKATATFKLSLKDFNLTNINYKGVGVEDEVEVTATVPYQ